MNIAQDTAQDTMQADACPSAVSRQGFAPVLSLFLIAHTRHLTTRFTTLCLALALAVTLSACGGGGSVAPVASNGSSPASGSGNDNTASPASGNSIPLAAGDSTLFGGNVRVGRDIRVEDYSQHGAAYALGNPATSAASVQNKLLFGGDMPYIADDGSRDGIRYKTLKLAHDTLNGKAVLPIASRDTKAYIQWNHGWTGKGVNVGVVDQFAGAIGIDSHGGKVALIINSVAPEADVWVSDSFPVMGAIEKAWEVLNANGVFIINNSFGHARFSRNANGTVHEDTNFTKNVTERVNQKHKATGLFAAYDPKMLFVFAAGNSGKECPGKEVQKCAFLAAVTHGLRQEGIGDSEAMIWVGALTKNGSRIANFSHTAGKMKDDFMVAHDDVLTSGEPMGGTSFAAPRVAGAAALVRHKFPNLNGQQLKTLLLQTATDMGAPGVDEIYGHGRLDLSNAISPQGALTP